MRSIIKSSILKLFVFILTVTITAAGCGGTKAGEPKSKRIKIGYLPIVHALPLLAASVWEEDSQVIIEPVKFTSWPELSDALNSGQIDGAVMMLPLAFMSRSKGIAVQVAALSHRNGDIFVVDKEINSAKELEGKKIAVPHRFSGHNILAHMLLEQEGVDKGKVEFIELAPPDMPAALQRGEIAGYIVADPFGVVGIESGKGKELIKAKDIWPNWIGNGLVIREDFINNHPIEVQKLITNFVDTGKRIDKDKNAAVEAVKGFYSAKPEIIQQSIKDEDYSDLKLDIKDFEKLQDYLVKLKLLESPLDLSKFLNPSFINKAYAGESAK